MDSPAMTLSKAAVASKSIRTPGDRDWRDKSQNRTLFRTALLHVSPGRAYCDVDKDGFSLHGGLSNDPNLRVIQN